jgi:hypothetical protein
MCNYFIIIYCYYYYYYYYCRYVNLFLIQVCKKIANNLWFHFCKGKGKAVPLHAGVAQAV